MKKLLVIIALLAAGGTYAAWQDHYTNPALPERLCFKNDPQNGYVPVVMVFEAEADGTSKAAGAQDLKWVEIGRIPSAAALAAYSAVEVIKEDGRPPAFPNPRPVIDAGPDQ